MTTPASHASDSLSLPPVPVDVLHPLSTEQVHRRTLPVSLTTWLSEPESNLIVLMGGFGTGKTTALLEFVAQDGVAAEYLAFEQVAPRAVPNAPIVVYDNVDAVNSLTGAFVDPPDLRDVAHVARSHRVILATRRLPAIRGDELVGQMVSEQRLTNMGFRNPVVVSLLPWDLDDLKRHAETTPIVELSRVIEYLSVMTPDETESLRRPLLIKMLMKVCGLPESAHLRPTLASIYHEYCAVALGTDYDQGRSRIPGRVKAEALANLAYDIFSGASSEPQPHLLPLAAPLTESPSGSSRRSSRLRFAGRLVLTVTTGPLTSWCRIISSNLCALCSLANSLFSNTGFCISPSTSTT